MIILKSNQPQLSSMALEVPQGEDLKEFCLEMFSTMFLNKGIGIAANQVGVLKRVIAINTRHCTVIVINPKLSNGRFEKISKEGCLSVPNKIAKVKRFNRITLEGFTPDWEPVKMELKALSAFCAQHEVDHLNGITI